HGVGTDQSETWNAWTIACGGALGVQAGAATIEVAENRIRSSRTVFVLRKFRSDRYPCLIGREISHAIGAPVNCRCVGIESDRLTNWSIQAKLHSLQGSHISSTSR